MRVQIASDLHCEFYKQERINPDVLDLFTGGDVLILAGDIFANPTAFRIETFIGPLCKRYHHVIYVKGNHEYYKSDPRTTDRHIDQGQRELPNLYVLDNNAIEIEGQKFFGGTMWFPRLSHNYLYESALNDFELIKGFKPWVHIKNGEFTREAMKCIDANTIVVTHHLPSYKSVPTMYMIDPNDCGMNAFYVSEQDTLINERQPKLWIHGHTHLACDYMIGKTRVISNPKGYPRERWTRFDPNLTIEI